MSSFVFRCAQVFLILLPFQFALAPVSGIDLPLSRVLALFLFCIWLAHSLARRNVRIPFDATSIGLLVFLFFACLSVVFAEQPDWSLRRLTFILTYLPIFLVFSGLVAEYGREGIRRLLTSFVFGATLAALVGLVQFFSQFYFGVGRTFHFWIESVLPFFLGPGFGGAVAEYPSLLVNIGGATVLRASAFFPDPHILAFFLGMAWPVSVALLRKSDRASHRLLLSISVVLLLIVDVLSFSRGGYIGLAFGLFTVTVFLSVGRDVMKRILMIAVIASGLLCCFAIDTPVRDRFLSTFSLEEGSNEGRLALFREAVAHIAMRPWGYGLANYPLSVKPTAEYREPIYAHNLYLDIATESGIIASGAFLFALFAAFSSMYRLRRDPIFVAGAVSLSVFFGHTLFETPLYSVHVLPILLLLLALPSGYDRIES